MAIWGSTGDHTAPEDANINAGFVSGESLARPWLNWVLWVLHTVYVTGIYYMTQIRPLTSGGTITARNFDGSVTYLTIDTTTGTGKVTADRGLLLGNNVVRASRMWFEDGPTIRVRDNNLLGFNIQHFAGGGGTYSISNSVAGNLLYYLDVTTITFVMPLKLPYSPTDGGYNASVPHYKFKAARVVSAAVLDTGGSLTSIASAGTQFVLRLVSWKNQVNSTSSNRRTVILTASGTYPATSSNLDLSTAYDVAVITSAGVLLDFENYSYAIEIHLSSGFGSRAYIFPDFYYELIQYSSGYLQ